jgi:hypothetical protein
LGLQLVSDVQQFLLNLGCLDRAVAVLQNSLQEASPGAVAGEIHPVARDRRAVLAGNHISFEPTAAEVGDVVDR